MSTELVAIHDAVDKLGLNGSYWSNYSDTHLEFSIMIGGSLEAREKCETSMLQGNPPMAVED